MSMTLQWRSAIRTKGVIRCPAACALLTEATIAADYCAALEGYGIDRSTRLARAYRRLRLRTAKVADNELPALLFSHRRVSIHELISSSKSNV